MAAEESSMASLSLAAEHEAPRRRRLGRWLRELPWRCWRRGSAGKEPAAEPNRRLVPNHTVAEDTPAAQHPNRGFANNAVRTTKYTLLSFVPRNLFEQFHRFANLYFLGIVLLNWVPQINAFGKEVAMIPVLFVLGVTAIKDAFEDHRRYVSDKRVNNSTCRVYSKSGTEEDYNGKVQLLTEIWAMAREFGYSLRRKKGQSAASQRAEANATRNQARDVASQINHDNCSYPPSPALCDDPWDPEPEETAAAILERIAGNTEEPVVPREPASQPSQHRYLLAEETREFPPSASNELAATGSGCHTNPAQPSSSSSNGPGDSNPSIAGNVRVPSYRKRKKSAAAETDQEFLEKRWRHEQAMKDKECDMEAQKVALQKAQLEQKEKKWARRFDLEEKRMNAEFRLRAQELEERTADREQRAEQARLQAASQQALLNVIQALAEHIKK